MFPQIKNLRLKKSLLLTNICCSRNVNIANDGAPPLDVAGINVRKVTILNVQRKAM